MHKRDRWFRTGSPLFEGQYALGCVCGWRSSWTRLHYQAERELKDHELLAAVPQQENP